MTKMTTLMLSALVSFTTFSRASVELFPDVKLNAIEDVPILDRGEQPHFKETLANDPKCAMTSLMQEETSVLGFYLINADTDERIRELSLDSRTVIDINSLPTTKLDIEVIAGNNVESVYMELWEEGTLSTTRTENFVPYALYGDRNGNFNGTEFNIGEYILTAEAWTGDNRTRELVGMVSALFILTYDNVSPDVRLIGDNPQEIELGNAYMELGATANDFVDGDVSDAIAIDATAVDTSTSGTYMVHYTVSDAAGNSTSKTRMVNVVSPSISILSFYLVNADTNERITEIENDRFYDFPDPSNLSIEAVATDGVESVYMDFEGGAVTRTENVAPYALFGDINGDFNGRNLVGGTSRFYVVSAIPYSGNNRSGVVGKESSVFFAISIAYSAPTPTVSAFPNPTSNSITVEFERPTEVQSAVLYDVLGRPVPITSAEKSSGAVEAATYDVSQLPQGTYFLKVVDTAGTMYEKTIIKE